MHGGSSLSVIPVVYCCYSLLLLSSIQKMNSANHVSGHQPDMMSLASRPEQLQPDCFHPHLCRVSKKVLTLSSNPVFLRARAVVLELSVVFGLLSIRL